MAAPVGAASATLPQYVSAQFTEKFINNEWCLKNLSKVSKKTLLFNTEENTCRNCLEHKSKIVVYTPNPI